jgi:hypothetical protein
VNNKLKKLKRRFDPHVIASFEITKSTEVNFYYDYYSGRIWANIRKFVKSERYIGPTKDGVKFEPKHLPSILKALEEADQRRDTMSDEVFLRLSKNKSVDLIVHASSYKGTVGIDLRERFQMPDGLEGWGKGIRLGVEYLPDLIDCIKRMSKTKPDLKELGSQASFDFDMIGKKRKEPNVEGVPDNLKEFFEVEEDNDGH